MYGPLSGNSRRTAGGHCVRSMGQCMERMTLHDREMVEGSYNRVRINRCHSHRCSNFLAQCLEFRDRSSSSSPTHPGCTRAPVAYPCSHQLPLSSLPALFQSHPPWLSRPHLIGRLLPFLPACNKPVTGLGEQNTNRPSARGSGNTVFLLGRGVLEGEKYSRGA